MDAPGATAAPAGLFAQRRFESQCVHVLMHDCFDARRRRRPSALALQHPASLHKAWAAAPMVAGYYGRPCAEGRRAMWSGGHLKSGGRHPTCGPAV